MRFSNGGSFQVVYGTLSPSGTGTIINIRFAIEALFLIAIGMLVALVLLASLMFHSVLLSVLAIGFLVLVIGYAWIGSAIERERLLAYVGEACGVATVHG
jgi:hypothetical protein